MRVIALPKSCARREQSIGFARALLLWMFLAALLLGGGPALADEPAGCDPRPQPVKLDAGQPLNLGLFKHQLVYYRCTRYDADLARTLRQARSWIDRRADHVKNPALVLDIDETSLSNWAELYHNDFGYIVDGDCDLFSKRACGQLAWERSAAAVAIAPTLDLFNEAKAKQVSIFFVTGRPENPEERAATEANLHKAGYDGWKQLYMRPENWQKPSIAPFKSDARKDIEAHGYKIIANIGDQMSDLAGGYAERRFKLPNPFYYLP